MTEFTAKEVFDIVDKVNNNVSEGFAGVYKKIDKVCSKYDEALVKQSDKIAEIDTELQVRKAVNGVKEEVTKEGRDWWKYVIRSMTVTALGSLIALAVKYLA